MKIACFLCVVLVAIAVCNARDERCNQPVESGLCYGHKPRFAFNSVKCDSFVYGGCGGNENNFETLQECQAACET